jgi:phosphoribosylformimino-5-aminoimidazole carboxamide ribotide isomerase
MIIPCIDIQGGKIVQLVQGRDRALTGGPVDQMLALFAGFPQIQVIDLDAAMGSGQNNEMVESIASRVIARVGGGVRSVERARELTECGAYRLIVGTSAFTATGPDKPFLQSLAAEVGAEKLIIALDSKEGRIVVKGWRESTTLCATDVIRELEPFCSGFLCTYVDKEGMMQGTDLDWFRSLRQATQHEITAAGGITTIEDVRALTSMDIHCAIGMAIYTGRLDVNELAALNSTLGDSEPLG